MPDLHSADLKTDIEAGLGDIVAGRIKPFDSARIFILGRERFARISAVEGIELTPDMRDMLDRFDRAGLSAADRRRAILKLFAVDAVVPGLIE